MGQFFGLLSGEEVNQTLAGYFMRVFDTFMNTKTRKMLCYLFEENPEVLVNFKKHFYLRSIAEAFMKIITFNGDDLTGSKFTEERLALLDDLFNML